MEDLVKLFAAVLDENASYQHEKGWYEGEDWARDGRAHIEKRDAAIGEFLAALGAPSAQVVKLVALG